MIQFIVFSRKRPLQLHGYLTSLFANCVGDFRVSVLLNAETPYYRAYSSVSDEFPQVGFSYESQFVEQLPLLVDTEAEFTCFGCDDAVFTGKIQASDIERAFKDGKYSSEADLLGFSLRMGRQIYADMFGRPLKQPAWFWDIDRQSYNWDFTAPTSEGDWAYPWEVLGTVYRTEFVKSMVASLGARSPSQLEERGSREWSKHTTLRRMACYGNSRLVVPTVNVIQTEFPGNGIRGAQPLSPEFLLDCWNNGLRLDTERYADMAPDSWRIGDFYLRRAA